jgi:predicted amidohydrolase
MRCDLSFAVAQFVPLAGDVAGNVERHLELIRLTAPEGAQLLLFPELSLSGYEIARASELAFSRNDARLRPLAQAASRCNMTLIVGAPLREEGKLYLAAFILLPDGGVDLYTKRHLGAFPAAAAIDGTVPPAESTVFSAGIRAPLLRLDEWTAGLAICADVGQPSHAQAAVDQGASLYLASMFVIPSEWEAECARLHARAVQHAIPVAFANFCGSSGGLAAAGRSSIWSEHGELLVQLNADRPAVAVATRTSEEWLIRTLSNR